MSRVKIHIDNSGPFSRKEARIKIQNIDGTPVGKGAARSVRLSGNWILRQYNNPVPCGELTVLYPGDNASGYEIIREA